MFPEINMKLTKQFNFFYRRHAFLIRNALHRTICVDKKFSIDLGGTTTTNEIVENIAKYL